MTVIFIKFTFHLGLLLLVCARNQTPLVDVRLSTIKIMMSSGTFHVCTLANLSLHCFGLKCIAGGRSTAAGCISGCFVKKKRF